MLDERSGRYTPDSWAREAVALYDHLKADRIVAESNFGGDMVRHTIQTVRQSAPVRLVHASRGKAIRAEPCAALYEQGRVSHVREFPKLEDEMVSWAPGDSRSPNRLDALVWALSDLMVKHQSGPTMVFDETGRRVA